MSERRTKVVVIEQEGRDKGKKFFITEMTASKGEAWAYRVLLVLGRNNVDLELPEDYASTGMAGLAQIGLKAFLKGMMQLNWFEVEPLLKEMFECVQIIPDPKNPVPRPLFPAETGDDDIHEVLTRVKLREEIFKLHVNFSPAAVQSLFDKEKPAAVKRSSIATKQQR